MIFESVVLCTQYKRCFSDSDCCRHEVCAYGRICYPAVKCRYGCPDGECRRAADDDPLGTGFETCWPFPPCTSNRDCGHGNVCTMHFNLAYTSLTSAFPLARFCDSSCNFLATTSLYVDPEFSVRKGMTLNLMNSLDAVQKSCVVFRCTSTSGTRSVSITCRSAAACATGNVVGRRGAEWDLPRALGLPASDGEPCSSDRVAATSPASRRRRPRPTTYRISWSKNNSSLGCKFAPRTV